MSYFNKNVKWTLKKEPLSDKALKEMRFVMDGILSGKLNHDQSSWHEGLFWNSDKTECGYFGGEFCGSSHCFAGWVEFFAVKSKKQHKGFTKIAPTDIPEFISKYSSYSDISTLSCEYWDDKYWDAGKFTEDRLGLTFYEGTVLFDANNTKKDLNKIIKRFEKGQRMVQ